MLDREARRRRLTEQDLARLGRAIATDVSVLSAQPMPGGIATATYRLRTTAGDHVLRIYRPRANHDPTSSCRDAYEVLSAVSSATGLAPRPTLVDAEGSLIGEPLLITSYIDGAPVAPDGSPRWTEGLAHALVAIHSAPLDGLGRLERDLTPRERVDRVMTTPPDPPDPLWTEAVAVLDAVADRVRPNPPTLIHADLWFGNTIWRDGALRGVVDWDGARVGDPARDVAGARTDLRLRPGQREARRLLDVYEDIRGPLHGIAFWDLLNDLGPRRWLSHFLEGYVELGAPIDPQQASAQIEEAIRADIAALR